MKYIQSTTEFFSDRPTAVTLGKFDGIHRGHQKLIREIARLQESGCRGIVFTIAPEDRTVLLTETEKQAILESYGIHSMIRCPYILEILTMEPEKFVSEILVRQLKAKYIVVGTDFRFGRNRSGDAALLVRLQNKYGFQVIVLEKECYGNREISSTYIREALSHAEMELVCDLLGFYYPVREVIQHGKKLGRRIGMPTINLIPDGRKLLPPPGVYYSDVSVEGILYHGVTNIGYKPTVDGSFLGAETYLYGASGDLYGREATVAIRKFRRRERKFSSVEELKVQMEKDILSGKEYFGVS